MSARMCASGKLASAMAPALITAATADIAPIVAAVIDAAVVVTAVVEVAASRNRAADYAGDHARGQRRRTPGYTPMPYITNLHNLGIRACHSNWRDGESSRERRSRKGKDGGQ